jgi:hypothetical protein
MESHRKEGTPPRDASSVTITDSPRPTAAAADSEDKPADDKPRRGKAEELPAGDKSPARR